MLSPRFFAMSAHLPAGALQLAGSDVVAVAHVVPGGQQCYPSYASIGKSVCMSVNTVRKYVAELGERGLVVTESTSVTTRDGRKRNGTLRYTILPTQNAVDLHNQRQLRRLEETVERMRVHKKLEATEEYPL